MLAVTMGLAALPAQASSGDFCQSFDLNPGAACYGAYHSKNKQVESWNSDGKGVGSCAGVYNGGVSGQTCVGNGSGYNEAFCTGSCSGKAGEPFAKDNSSYNSLFTGWAEW